MVFMCAYSEWDEYYKEYPLNELGWELGKPRPLLVEFVEKGLIKNARFRFVLWCGN